MLFVILHRVRLIATPDWANDRNKKVKKPGGASHRGIRGFGRFRLALLEIIVADVTGGEPLEDQRSFFPSASVDHLLGS
jgi:hypothetical protein